MTTKQEIEDLLDKMIDQFPDKHTGNLVLLVSPKIKSVIGDVYKGVDVMSEDYIEKEKVYLKSKKK